MVGGFTPFKRNVTSDNTLMQKQKRRSDEYLAQGQGKVLDPQQIVENIMRGELYLPRNMSSLAKDLAKNILVVDPNMRLEIADIKQHKFFRGIQWDLIAARKIKPPFIPPMP
jgi:serine/threonine protein kinase